MLVEGKEREPGRARTASWADSLSTEVVYRLVHTLIPVSYLLLNQMLTPSSFGNDRLGFPFL